MSETPRCDAFGDEPYKGDNARLVLLWIRFAESLERDLTQAKAELAAVTAERDALREELNAVLSDWNDVVRASGSKTNGGLVGHVISLKADAERWRVSLRHRARKAHGEPMANFYEFFAGGGMARAGLGPDWQCLLANDFDPKKAASYAANWGDDHLRVGDVAALTTADLPAGADLAWASFPCQDLSLAGAGAGLKGDRSGTFWPFWKLIKALGDEDRAPRLVVLENVCGALSSHDGKDFAAISSALSNNGYRFGAVVINAVHFLPQSRPRLFIIGVRKSSPIPRALIASGPEGEWHPSALVEAYSKLSKRAQSSWEWWRLPAPPARTSIFADLVEDEPHGVTWHTAAETKKLLGMMNPLNLAKVEAAKKAGGRQVGTIYKRTRADGPNGEKVQRAEIRFDDVAGCLRTPTGGSSRQTIMVIEGKRVRSRLLSPREAARLMGLPDTYALPKNYNDAYHLAGDGVAVPVVRFLAEHILEPLLAAALAVEKKAA